jgi:hypothetical protein
MRLTKKERARDRLEIIDELERIVEFIDGVDQKVEIGHNGIKNSLLNLRGMCHDYKNQLEDK